MIAILLARSGSKGVQDKNILQIGARRLSHHAISAYLDSSFSGDIVYSSDSLEYLRLAEEFVVTAYPEQSARLVLHRRSQQTSGDEASSWEACKEILGSLDVPTEGEVLLISGTCPTLTSEDLNKIKATMQTGYSGLTVRLNDYPVENTFLMSDDGRVRLHAMSSTLSGRQKAQKIFRPDGHAYWRRAEQILRDTSFPDENTRALDLNKEYYVNVDTWADVNYARYLLENK